MKKSFSINFLLMKKDINKKHTQIIKIIRKTFFLKKITQVMSHGQLIHFLRNISFIIISLYFFKNPIEKLVSVSSDSFYHPKDLILVKKRFAFSLAFIKSSSCIFWLKQELVFQFQAHFLAFSCLIS